MKQFIKKVPVVSDMAFASRTWIRRQLGRRRLRKIRNLRPLRLVIGASGVCEKEWIGTDVEYLNLLKSSDWESFFNRSSVDAMLAEHVWEHLTPAQGLEAAQRCFEYLRPGGYLRVAVPDGLNPDPQYLDWVKPGGTGDGADDHKVLYNHRTFSEMFRQAGFRVVLLEHFDEAGSFHATDWRVEDGMICRSKRFDNRNQGGTLRYSSLILDAIKDA